MPLRQILTAALLCLTLAGCESTLFAGLNVTNQRRGIEQQRDVVFDPANHLALDVYRPAGTVHAPIVVFFYGGSWVNGKRQWYRFVGTGLAAQGVTVVIPDYRKYPQVRMDGFMSDAAHAVGWARAHATELGGSPDDIFVMGHSAGGQVAGLLATSPHWLGEVGMKPNELAGFIGLAGVYDFVPIDPKEKDMLGMFGTAIDEQKQAEAIHFVDGHEPPMLLLHGTADKEVEPSNSISLARHMQARGEPAELRLVPGMGHSPLVFALSRPLRENVVLDDILAFIHAHPKAQPH